MLSISNLFFENPINPGDTFDTDLVSEPYGNTPEDVSTDLDNQLKKSNKKESRRIKMEAHNKLNGK